MKGLILIALFSIAVAGPAVLRQEDSEVVPQSAIDYINSVQSHWVASKDWVGSMTIGTAKGLAQTEISPRDFPEHNWGALIDNLAIPTSFDSRIEWPKCIHSILDQGACGSCWAFGATEALSDRYCINSQGSVNVVLSPQYLVSCDFTSFGCSGGFPDLAWRYMSLFGVPTQDCVGYTASDSQCPSTCDDGSALKKYKVKGVSKYSGIVSTQTAIMNGGPVEASFTVFEDFISYQSGVYVYTWGEELGGHAVKMIGWGNDGTLDYWICANSWSTQWGMSGFFNIAFGQCGIDSSTVAGTPSI